MSLMTSTDGRAFFKLLNIYL